MLDNEKVDQFYNFLKNEYYNWWEPEKIVLISPNHFHADTKEIQTICETANVNYKSTTKELGSELHNLWVKCDENWEIFDILW